VKYMLLIYANGQALDESEREECMEIAGFPAAARQSAGAAR
jgi:hypothetical protein